MKILLILVLARCFSRAPTTPRGIDLRSLVIPLALTALPTLVVLLQPDLGTGGVLLVIFASMAFVAGARFTPFVTVFAAALASGPLLWRFLKAYQQQRIVTFFDPERDPLGAGYHIIQSRIAVGSGQFWGKGFLQGTQNQLNFLPEQHTDFIFSVFAEEWGFVGSMVLLTLYIGLLLRGFVIVNHARDAFGAFLCLGVIGMIFWQVVVNVGMGMLLMLAITGFHGLTMTPVWAQLIDALRGATGFGRILGFSTGMALLMLGRRAHIHERETEAR